MECVVCSSAMAQASSWRYRCRECGFEQSTLQAGAGRGVDGLETLRRTNFRRLVDHLKLLMPLSGLRCLEVGCAEGWFLDALSGTGVMVSAIEPSEMAVTTAARGYEVIQGFFPEALPPGSQYDLIVWNDVFEHLPDPKAALWACETHLSQGGWLVLNLPNSDGVFYRIAKAAAKVGWSGYLDRMWQKDFVSPHLTYFSASNLPRFVARQSQLELQSQFRLPSLTKEGLKERLAASHPGLLGAVLATMLRIALPALRWLPADAMVFVFRKPG